MPKIASIYYLEDAEVEGQRPNAVFLGAMFSSSKDPNGPRKVLSLSKFHPGQGPGSVVKATSIHYSDGSVEHIADKVLICKMLEFEPAKVYPSDGDDKIPF